MKKLLTVLSVLATLWAPAQTLFTYSNEAVSTDEFMRAFKKNNTGPKNEKALKEYLDLYIASRLKIREAKEQRFDTLPQLLSDLSNLRQQILPNYLNDKESLEKLVTEAAVRSQKDIHAAHIFIAFSKNTVVDSVTAKNKRDAVLTGLTKGIKFDSLARQYSDDPSVKATGGDMGWVTAFTLPYELENIVYATAPGRPSPVYTSKAGYHIFKNLGERKAVGRIRAAQILLAFPPDADAKTKAGIKKLADSLYARLQAGDDFGKLATAFSNDVISAASAGQMAEFGVGDYEPAFEATVITLPKNGAITKPFLTSHGYHIVKRLSLTPISGHMSAEAKDELRRRVEMSDRALSTKTVLAQKVLKQSGYKNPLVPDAELWVYTDSVLSYLPPRIKLTINPATPVLKIGDKTLTVQDWISHAQAFRYKPDGSSAKPHPQVWDEFLQATALQYYQDHLEEYNEDFRRQVTEFAEGSLFFEITQRQVWTPAQTDTTALAAYYQKNKSKYVWRQSADAVLFYAGDAAAANAFYKELQKFPANWRTIAGNYSEQITTDSGRFELSQIPKAVKDKLTAGTVTTSVVNKADNTVSFAYIIAVHTKEEPRSFADAKGLVINDYQAELEKAWLAELKKKYPVVVNEKVWKNLTPNPSPN